MGINSEAHANHKRSIAHSKDELALLDKGIAKEISAEIKIDKEIASLATKAVSGDRDALRKQRELHDKKAEYGIQRSNLESLAAPIRENLAKAESDSRNFEIAEAKERLAEQIAALPVLAAQLSKTILPIATSFGDFRKQFDADAVQALSMIGGDDGERIQRLGDQVRSCMVRGLRAQIAADFDRVGLHLFETSKYEGAGFAETVAPVLQALIAAIEINLPATVGSKKFRAITNISGLHGLRIVADEILTLSNEDPLVKKLIADGALVELSPTLEVAG